jgi:CRP-like cAMP-binding protein
MADTASDADYHVWGVDRTVYGPVDASTLLSWVQNERVTADTWVFRGSDSNWQKAAEMPELQALFAQEPGLAPAGTPAKRTLTASEVSQLQEVKILAGLSNEQLGRFAQLGEVEEVPAGRVVVRQGERDEALYLILQGEMRVRIMVEGVETVVTTLTAGDCFGDLALLDHGPRSADVVADTDSKLVKISGPAFDELCKAEVDASTLVLRALDKTLTGRIRADNRRYGNAVGRARSKL